MRALLPLLVQLRVEARTEVLHTEAASSQQQPAAASSSQQQPAADQQLAASFSLSS